MRLLKSIEFALALGLAYASAGLVEVGPDGKLVYRAHALAGAVSERGDVVPDFSWCGFRSNEAPIPEAPVVLRVSAVAGDNRAALQAAIDEVSRRPLDGSGIRGALFLEAGEYKVDGTLQVKASGVVLRGAGFGTEGTRIVATRKSNHTLIQFSGSGGPSETGGRFRVMDGYVPVGARTFKVATGHGFKPGDAVFLRLSPNQAWIDLLDMAKFGWSADGYNLEYKRRVLGVSGDILTLDAPVVDPIDGKYGSATVAKYDWNGKIQNSGIEDMRLISEYQGEEDENHAWTAVGFNNIQDAWARRIEGHHFAYSTVTVGNHGYRVSILDSKNIDPKSQTTGGRKYSFNVTGQLVLVKGCSSRNGRHDFVTGARVPGPNAFVRCSAELQRSDMGPHHRWSTGLLFDNVTGDGSLNVQNREESGSGHGWAGAQTLFWNCRVKSMVVQSPPGHINWAIGNLADITGKGSWYETAASYVESTGKPVAPASLFEQQLKERGYGVLGSFPEARTSMSGHSIRPLGGELWAIALPHAGIFSLSFSDLAGRKFAPEHPLEGRQGLQAVRISGYRPALGHVLSIRDSRGRLSASAPRIR